MEKPIAIGGFLLGAGAVALGCPLEATAIAYGLAVLTCAVLLPAQRQTSGTDCAPAAGLAQSRCLAERLEVAAMVFGLSNEGILVTDADGIIQVVNDALCRITGFSRQEIIGNTPRIFKSGKQDDGFYQEMWESLHTQGKWSGELWNRRKDGSVFPELITIASVPAPDGKVGHFVAVFADASVQKQTEQRMAYLAQHDYLTGLANRGALDARMERAIAHAHANQTQVALLFLDLDRFKNINDALGHAIGDQLLKVVGDRLRHCLREDDTIARQGADEFMVLAEDVEATGVVRTAQQIMDVLSNPVNVDGYTLNASASMGIAMYPDSGTTAEELAKNAGIAMLHAKEQGGGNFQFFNGELNAKVKRTIEIEKDLRIAISSPDQFVVHYQPKVSMRTGKIVGLEALIRWQHPKHGLIQPGGFIQIAEETHLVIDIWRWMIRAVTAQIAEWGGTCVPVAVNVSPVQFRQAGFVPELVSVINDAGIDPGCLELEITEGVLIKNQGEAIDILRQVHGAGLTIALDDFGTGYSSLCYLTALPLDILKIDKSFVAELPGSPRTTAVIKHLVALGHNLGMKVVAEGVETTEQDHVLRGLGCDIGQGYYYSKAVPALELGFPAERERVMLKRVV